MDLEVVHCKTYSVSLKSNCQKMFHAQNANFNTLLCDIHMEEHREITQICPWKGVLECESVRVQSCGGFFGNSL